MSYEHAWLLVGGTWVAAAGVIVGAYFAGRNDERAGFSRWWALFWPALYAISILGIGAAA